MFNTVMARIGNKYVQSEEKLTKEMLDQAIETLAYTIDAKDRYTKGHSSRVAKYSRMIANVLGKSEEECRKVYLAGLLHDIGKISISDDIINKEGRLTEDEFAKIKKHPGKGALILDKMRDIPYLKVGANYHHERYDGKGYPSGLKGEEIPEIARIIAVADAYDAMTSIRSYRSIMEQVEVKQEIWRGIGTQFDPIFAKVMISLIDADVNYDMREKPGELDEIVFEDISKPVIWPSFPEERKSEIDTNQDTDLSSLAAFILNEDKWSIEVEETLVTQNPVEIAFRSITRPEAKYLWDIPSVLLYTSENGKLLGPGYEELGVFMSAGYSWKAGSSVYDYSLLTPKDAFVNWNNWVEKNKKGLEYTVKAHREDQMIYLTIENELVTVEGQLTLSESNNKPVYFLIIGEYCSLYLLREKKL